MIRYLVMSIVLVAIFGLLSGSTLLSNIVELGLLATAYLMLALGYRRGQNFGALPVFHQKMDFSILIFIFAWLVTSLVNGIFGFVNLIVLLRYIPLAYLIGKFLDAKDIKVISLLIVLVGLSQVLFGALQLVGALPRVLVDVRVVNDGLYGVFKDTISYSAIMLVSMIVMREIFTTRRYWYVMLSFVFLVFLWLSESRAYFMIGALYFMIRVLGISVRKSAIMGLIFVFGIYAFGMDLGSSNKHFLFILSGGYFTMAMHQRLGIILELLPQFLFSPHLLLGLGSDIEHAVAHAISHYSFYHLDPGYLIYIFEDVYWSSMLMYYGLLGSVAFICYLMGIYLLARKLQKHESINHGVLMTFNWLFICALPLGLTGQVFEVKAYSLILWIFAGAILIERRLLRENSANK